MFASRIAGSFKPVNPMTEVEAEQALSVVTAGFRDIFQRRSSALSFEELYRTAYNLVIHKHGMKLYTGVEKLVHEHLVSKASQLRSIQDDSAFVHSLSCVWRDHTRDMRMVGDVLMYMDRNFVAQYKLASTRDMSLMLFAKNLLMNESIEKRTIRSVLDRMDLIREGTVSLETCRDVFEAYVKTSEGNGCENILVQVLKPAFIDGTFAYYSKLTASVYKTEVSAEEFCLRGLKAYEVERSLAKSLGLDDSMLDSVNDVLDRAWIDPYYEKISCDFSRIIRQGNEQDARNMHALFSRSDRAGKHLLHLFRQEVNSVLAEDPNNIPVTIEKLKKFNSVIMRSLSRDYASELQSVAECVLLSSVSKSLAEWLHKRIRTASSEIEKSLEDFLVLFRFLSSKDVFEAYYRYFLARRLLSQSGSDSQIELLVVNQLKQECGNSYSSKIEAMLNDMQSSALLTREYKQSSQHEELLHPILLTGSVWSGMKHLAVNLPRRISESIATFERFYLAKFQGRKLTWIHSHGSAELKFFTNSEFFILSCTVLQAIILDLFNHSDRLSLDFICKSLNTSFEEIRRHLLSLHVNTKCQILINDSPAASTDAESILQVNLAFQAKSKHVKVPLIVDDSASSNDVLDMANREETLDTASGLEQVVMEDRKHLIEAAIVRIMKTKRQLDQNGIVVELAKIFENRFTPSINMIKDRVENLVDREFIARDNENVKLFYYVA